MIIDLATLRWDIWESEPAGKTVATAVCQFVNRSELFELLTLTHCCDYWCVGSCSIQGVSQLWEFINTLNLDFYRSFRQMKKAICPIPQNLHTAQTICGAGRRPYGTAHGVVRRIKQWRVLNDGEAMQFFWGRTIYRKLLTHSNW